MVALSRSVLQNRARLFAQTQLVVDRERGDRLYLLASLARDRSTDPGSDEKIESLVLADRISGTDWRTIEVAQVRGSNVDVSMRARDLVIEPDGVDSRLHILYSSHKDSDAQASGLFLRSSVEKVADFNDASDSIALSPRLRLVDQAPRTGAGVFSYAVMEGASGDDRLLVCGFGPTGQDMDIVFDRLECLSTSESGLSLEGSRVYSRELDSIYELADYRGASYLLFGSSGDLLLSSFDEFRIGPAIASFLENDRAADMSISADGLAHVFRLGPYIDQTVMRPLYHEIIDLEAQ
jgi:hypothetical protein